MAYQGSITLVDLSDGQSGSSGINTATVYLYQRATTTPSGPNGTLRYTFSTHTLSGTYFNGWEQSIDNLSGSNPIWIIAATATASADIGYDDIPAAEWSTPIKMAQDGQDGQDGAPGQPGQNGAPGTNGINTATVYIYKRINSIPSTPADATYTFADGSFTTPTGWSGQVPTSDGNPCYVCSAVAISNQATAILEWSTPVILVEDGTDGENGISPTVESISNGVKITDAEGNITYIYDGINGTSYYTHVRYSANADGHDYVSIPTSSTIYIGVYSGTSNVAPAYNDSGWTWSKYVGEDGNPGAAGVSVTEVKEVYYITSGAAPTQSTLPNGTPITSTSTSSNVWTTVIPAYIANGRYYTSLQTSLSSGTSPVFSTIVLNQGLTDANTNAAEANAATALLGGHFIYRSTASTSGRTPASANVVQTIKDNNNIDVTDDPTKWEYNTHIGANGIKLRYNENDLSSWTSQGISIYNPITHNAAMQLTGQTLNFYNPNNDRLSLSLNSNGLNFYGSSIVNPDASLTTTGLVLSKGGIQTGTSGQNGFVYLSSEDYQRKDATHSGITINGHTPTAAGTDDKTIDDPAWREIIGTKFGVDSEGNLYANNANLSNATVEGAITATSLTIGSGSDSYNAINAMNAAGYTIEIINDITAAPNNVVINDNSTYLYPIMYHNGIKVESVDIINTQYIWYRGSDTIGIQGDSDNGGMVADYGYTYRVAYSFDDGEVGQAPSVQQVLVDPSKYITRLSDIGITIHPEDTSENNYLQIDGNGITIYKNTDSVAQFGTTARIGRINNSRFLINDNSLQAYSGTDITPYFEVNSTGLSWGNNVAATTAQVNAAALVADNYLTNITGGGVYIHSADTPSDASSANAKGIQISDNLDIIRNGISIASYGAEVRIGDENEIHIIIDNNSLDIKDSDGLGLATFGNDYLSIGAVPTDSYETLLGKKWATIDSNGFKVQGKAEFAPFRTYLLGGIAESTAQKMAEYIDEDVNTSWSYYLSCAPISGTTIKILFAPTGSTSFTVGVAATNRGIIYDGVRTFQNTTATSGGESGDSGLVSPGYEHVSSGRVTYVTYESSEATAGTYIFVGVHDDQYQHGDGSAIFGTNLIGQKECQTVIGRYNNNSTSNVFEIGNGSSSTRSNALTVNWNGNTTIAGTLTQSSDRRLKNHKSYLSNDAIEFIRELKPAYFVKDEQSHVGFYAQDVEEIDSWGCMVGEMNGYKTLGYTELIAPLVTYCQYLEKRIAKLESQFEGGID